MLEWLWDAMRGALDGIVWLYDAAVGCLTSAVALAVEAVRLALILLVLF